MKSSLNLFFRGLSLVCLLWAAKAELATFILDPARSSVSLSGSVSGIVLLEQSPGSLTTSYEGSIVADLTAGQIEFVGGSRMAARELNSWMPGPGGVEGSALASYGAKGNSGGGIFSVNAVAASRRLLFDLTSGPLPLTGGGFDATSLVFKFVETNNPVLDYSVVGVLNDNGSRQLAGLATNTVTGTSSLTTVNGVETLKISVAATFLFELLLPNDTQLILTGELVATRGSVAEPPKVEFTPPPPGGTSMSLSWPVNYKLQRATTLSPPDWTDVPGEPPLTIPFTKPGEFFQIVPK